MPLKIVRLSKNRSLKENAIGRKQETNTVSNNVFFPGDIN